MADSDGIDLIAIDASELLPGDIFHYGHYELEVVALQLNDRSDRLLHIHCFDLSGERFIISIKVPWPIIGRRKCRSQRLKEAVQTFLVCLKQEEDLNGNG